MKRKTLLVSIYYYEDEPKIHGYEDDYDFSLSNSIKEEVKSLFPESDVFDVAIDDTKPVFFSIDSRIAKYVFRLLRKIN